MKPEFIRHVFIWLAGGIAVAALNTGLMPALAANQPGAPPANWTMALGGSRALAAGFTWLRAYEAWRQHDAVRTEALIRATVALDNRPDVFWVNGARMIAHDFAAWDREADASAPTAVAVAQRERYARRAVAFLEEATRRRGASAAVLLEMAAIQFHTLGDLPAAAESYRAAALQPDTPWHAGRMHARVLVRMGRRGEAARWLRELLPTLPENDPAAQKELVRQWLAELERELLKQ